MTSSELVNRLFNSNWKSMDKRIPKDTNPGVYLISYSDQSLDGKQVRIEDICYIGMSNSKGGVVQRIKQFKMTVNNDDLTKSMHSGARRYKRSGMKKKGSRFYYTYVTIECNTQKKIRSHDDLRKMGSVAKLEFDVLAYYKECTGKEPILNMK